MGLAQAAIDANAAMATAEGLIATYLTSLTAGTKAVIVPAVEWKGVAALSLPWSTACANGGLARYAYMPPRNNHADSIRWAFNLPEGGILPLTFRFTTDAGELS